MHLEVKPTLYFLDTLTWTNYLTSLNLFPCINDDDNSIYHKGY